MKVSTAVIKVVYDNTEIFVDEVVGITSLFKYYMIVNNSNIQLNNDFRSIPNFKILDNHNLNGLAGAYNLALSNLEDVDPQFVLFLDDDTDSSSLFNLFDDNFYSVFENQLVAATAPIYIDSNTLTRGSHMLLSTFTFKRIPRNYIGISQVSFMINSCSVWRYDALKEIGKYDEVMKIDHIDTDYCLRATEMGYGLILNSNYSFKHTIGNRISYRFLFKSLRSGNHSPERRKMIMFNSILILRKHVKRFPVLIYIIFERIFYELLGVIYAEDQKMNKIKMSLKGLFQGFFFSSKDLHT
jgi:rhamnosyltransferase